MKSFTLAGVAVALLLAGCGSRREGENPVATLPTARVRVQTVESKPRVVNEEVAGTVQAKLRATLEARVSGRIERLPVVLGDAVRKGQLIARLDAVEIAARLEQAEASLRQAESEWKRVAALFEVQSISRSEFDSAQARQRVAAGALAEAKAMMSYVEIVAPFDGVVTKKWADVGDVAAPGKSLVSLEDPTMLQIEADVPQAISSHVKRGARLTARVDGVGADLAGTVSEIAPAADAVSRTLRVKVDLPDHPGLGSGQFARLHVPVGESISVRVPAAAVVQRGQLEIIFAVTNRLAHLRLVKTGKGIGGEVEILSGLQAGDVVVIEGAGVLVDGQPVEAR